MRGSCYEPSTATGTARSFGVLEITQHCVASGVLCLRTLSMNVVTDFLWVHSRKDMSVWLTEVLHCIQGDKVSHRTINLSSYGKPWELVG